MKLSSATTKIRVSLQPAPRIHNANQLIVSGLPQVSLSYDAGSCPSTIPWVLCRITDLFGRTSATKTFSVIGRNISTELQGQRLGQTTRRLGSSSIRGVSGSTVMRMSLMISKHLLIFVKSSATVTSVKTRSSSFMNRWQPG